ncbi:ABC-F family ATP-binding cassette domain-containing protein [Candidatus Peregrinibacteria bacterium]|jgi:ATP-binding cassette, subfamily F, member 3|nr:ABC-F family ATP-binding cassette domain-containing protein [Candidatus Peregrinibacteria bacterium]MBT4631440.1 ABC-F family ATP-binding cassette domain-containing protein [Candidatus Peregrinibacteria bacterium]MBT5516911.1 ABC-F family ATP-binding cassette domain-containing protein [Candidatus Peregrinibacteria bacterium]MBT5823829.1 ABC-F family ATP-binding cassette domain-containing protein [Candidatus Peregrinibacteria bacterium]
MIRIKHLSKFYGDHDLFEDVSLTIGSKEKVGLIGRNGSGKSTFIKILQGFETPDHGEVEMSKSVRVQSLEQHLDFTEPTILEQVCKSLPLDAYNQEWRAESILMGLGFIKTDMQRAPDEFSSGMQVRLRLAQALVSDADLLLLDEPTNYLDILSLRWLESFLQDWKGSFILVTHDQTFMQKVVTHVVGIHRGKMRKMEGGPTKLMHQLLREEDVHEKTRVKQEKKDAKTKVFIREFRAGARSAGLVQSRIKSLAKQKIHKKLEKLPEIRFHFKSDEFQGSELLRATNISYSYDENHQIISKFSLAVRPKDRIAIIGPNGKGKTTLLKLLVRDLEIQTGKLKTHENIRLGYFGPSQIADLNPQNSILTELIALPNTKEQLVRSVCGSLLFTGSNVKKKISSLSGGERSRVALAKLMLSKNNILILDEPTNHLDMESCQALTEALNDFPGTVVFVSHDEKIISELATRLVVFEQGHITVMEETYERFLAKGGWMEEETFRPKKIKKSVNKEEYLERKEKTRKLRTIKKAQQKLEKQITKLEAEQEVNANILNTAYIEKDQRNIFDYGEKAKIAAHAIEDAYTELERLAKKEEDLSSGH